MTQLHSPQDHAVGKEVYRLIDPRDINWKQALVLLKAWNKEKPEYYTIKIIQRWKSIDHNIVVTQLIHTQGSENIVEKGVGRL